LLFFHLQSGVNSVVRRVGCPWEQGEFIEVLRINNSEHLQSLVHRPSARGRGYGHGSPSALGHLARLNGFTVHPIGITQLSKLAVTEELQMHTIDGFSRPIIFSASPGLDRWAIDHLHKAFAVLNDHLSMRGGIQLSMKLARERNRPPTVVDLTADTQALNYSIRPPKVPNLVFRPTFHQ